MSETIERPVQTITTPFKKHVVVMLEYITGREAEAIAIASQGADGSYEKSIASRDVAVNLILKSIDGVTEGLSEIMKDMHLEDYTCVTDAVTALVDVKKK